MQLVSNIIVAQHDYAYVYQACFFPNFLDFFVRLVFGYLSGKGRGGLI